MQVPFSESQAEKLEEIVSDRRLSKAEAANKIFQLGLNAIAQGWELPN